MRTYTCGLVSVSFRGKTPEEILPAAKAAGLSSIEWGSDVHAPCADISNLERIAKLQKEQGIACSSYGTYFRIGVNATKEIEPYIAAAKVLGTDILRLWCGDKGSAKYTDAERESLLCECIALAEIAKAQGVKLCMECHINTYTDTKESALWLMQSVNSPYFRMYWQPNQFVSAEENLAYARLLAPYAEHIHVFHWLGKEKFPLQCGMEVWRQYLACFDGERTLLLEFMPDGKIESLPTEADTLARIIGENT